MRTDAELGMGAKACACVYMLPGSRLFARPKVVSRTGLV